MTQQHDYLLGSETEVSRLQVQAQVWEPATETMLDRIAVPPGWRCVDLACGPLGVLAPLRNRAGADGIVIGVDMDGHQLDAARAALAAAGIEGVELLEGDAYDTGLPRESFDLVHARFILAPVGRDDDLIREMLGLARPSGIVALQEPEISSWNYEPRIPEFDQLKQAFVAAFERGGGDFNAGLRLHRLLRDAGLRDVETTAAVVPLRDRHPYLRLATQFAISLRKRILEGGLMTEAELDRAAQACAALADDPRTFMLSFTVVQAWGRKPAGA